MGFGSLGLGIQMDIRGITEEEVATCMFVCCFYCRIIPCFFHMHADVKRCMTRLQCILRTETLSDFLKSQVDFKMAYT